MYLTIQLITIITPMEELFTATELVSIIKEELLMHRKRAIWEVCKLMNKEKMGHCCRQ